MRTQVVKPELAECSQEFQTDAQISFEADSEGVGSEGVDFGCSLVKCPGGLPSAQNTYLGTYLVVHGPLQQSHRTRPGDNGEYGYLSRYLAMTAAVLLEGRQRASSPSETLQSAISFTAGGPGG